MRPLGERGPRERVWTYGLFAAGALVGSVVIFLGLVNSLILGGQMRAVAYILWPSATVYFAVNAAIALRDLRRE